MPESLSPEVKDFIDSQYQKLRNDIVLPWASFNPDIPFKSKYPSGKDLFLYRITYHTRARNIMWGEDYIEEYIKVIILNAIKKAKSSKPTKSRLEATKRYLLAMVASIYDEMADIDYTLIIKETSDRSLHRYVSREILTISKFIDQAIQVKDVDSLLNQPLPPKTDHIEQEEDLQQTDSHSKEFPNSPFYKTKRITPKLYAPPTPLEDGIEPVVAEEEPEERKVDILHVLYENSLYLCKATIQSLKKTPKIALAVWALIVVGILALTVVALTTSFTIPQSCPLICLKNKTTSYLV